MIDLDVLTAMEMDGQTQLLIGGLLILADIVKLMDYH